MQSFLQYRKFRKQAYQQYQTDIEKAQKLAHNPRRTSGTFDSASTLREHDHSQDVEGKEEHDVDCDCEGCIKRNKFTLPGEQDPTAQEGNVPQEEAETLQKDLRPQATQPRTRSHAPSHSHSHYNNELSQPISQGEALGQTMTGISVRKKESKGANAAMDDDSFVVGYQGENDPMNPHNWSVWTRAWATFLIAAIGFVVGVASSIDSSILRRAAEEFGVSQVTESLATGLYLVGFGCGALFAGPISETLGRNPVYIFTMSLYLVFIMASGLAPNIGAQLAFRFLAGFFGSTPLTCAGGSISDLWSPSERVLAFPVFANAAFTGPLMGPVVGGFISQSSLSWRWSEWVTLIVSGAVLVLVVLTQPETYPPILLKWKAAHLREITGDPRYKAEVELRKESAVRRWKRALYRPFMLTAREPIIGLIAVYLTVIYIILFTFLDGYTYIFEEIHHTSEGVTGLCFLALTAGLFLACLILAPIIYPWSKRKLARLQQENGADRLPPEFRLWWAIFSAPAIPIGLFWMAWTSYEWISLWSPLAGSVLVGYGILGVFISSYQYIIDSYETFSASALASVTLIRYVAAGGSVVYGIPFYENMGVHWTLTILGGLAAVLVPIPYIFYIYGPRIRKASKFAISKE